MKVVKYGSSGCGPCSRMSHYDEKVVRELGLDFEYVKKNQPEYRDAVNEKIKGQLESIPSPTYVLVEGSKVLGSFAGGCDKGRFRTKIQGLTNAVPMGDDDWDCDDKWGTNIKCEDRDVGDGYRGQGSSVACDGSGKEYGIVQYRRSEDDGSDEDTECDIWEEWFFAGEKIGSFEKKQADNIGSSGWKTLENEVKKNDRLYKVGKECGSCGAMHNKTTGDGAKVWEIIECKEEEDKCECSKDSDCKDDEECDGCDCKKKKPDKPDPDKPDEGCKDEDCKNGEVCCEGECSECNNNSDCNDGKCVDCKCVDNDTPEPEPEPEPEPLPEPEPPPELPPTIKPDDYDCGCPPETIQLWYDQERGVYGSSYDKTKISSIQFIDAWKDTRRLKLWLRPGNCALDSICECVNLCSTTTAGGFDITEMQVNCEPNEKENSVILTFTGSYLEAAKQPEKPEGEMETEPAFFAAKPYCEAKIQSIEISDGKICPKGSGETVTIDISTSCCEPNNGNFRIDPDGKGMQNMRGMSGVSFPQDGDSNNDHGEGRETKRVKIKCDDFPYDIKDHDWAIRWQGDCDQDPGKDFSITNTFKASSGCGPGKPDEPEPDKGCKDDDECPPGYICENGDCVLGCRDDSDCQEGEVCIDGVCVPAHSEVGGSFYPNCLMFQCCPDCDNIVPPFEDGDNDDCTNRPEPVPVPGTDTAAAVYLYDRLNHTYVFCCPIQVDVTWLLPYDALPPIFQRYITALATVRAAAQLVNNPQLFQLLKDRENTLRMECMNYELEQGDLNFLGQPDHTAYVGYQPIQTLNR